VSAQSGATSAPIRFGVFAFDVLSSELRRDGVRVTIGEQPTQVLRLLLERHGELVTREDLRATLWPDQTFIDDFDQGLNAAVKRLRDLLGDKADDPQLIETVPRRGYRFIGRVDEPEAVRAPPISSSSEPGPRRWTRSRALWVGGCTAVVILAGAVAVMWMPLRSTSPPAAPATPPARVVALTTLPGVESFAAFSPDGNAIAFTWNGEKGDNFDVYVKDIGSSQVRRLTKDPGRDVSPVWSPDGRQIAFVRFDGVAGRLHITSALTASEIKVSALPPVPDRLKYTLWCRSIDWSLDGRYIAAQYQPLDGASPLPNGGIYSVPVDGSAARPVTHPQTPAVDSCPAFSPDRRHLAFASCTSSAAGRCDVHVIDIDAGLEATGPTRQLTKEGIPDVTGVAWARDGNSVVFGTRGGTLQTLWRVPIDGSHRPEQITTAGFAAAVPAIARAHDRLAFSRDMNDVELYRFSPDVHHSPGSVRPAAMANPSSLRTVAASCS
jgi:Tol biopolymer transport system component/DNA-binding winged helix-turn-helix (wHTH) protein